MSPHTQTEIRLSGSSVGFQGASCLSHPGQDLRFPQAWFKLAEEPYPESGSEVSGKGDLFQASCATGTSTPKSSADGSDIRSTFGPLFLQQRGQGISREVVNSSSVEMDKRSPSVAMTTDASNSGWGATLGSRSASGRWSAAESKLHINHLELLAVLKAVHCFTCHLRMKTIVLQLDNVTATSYLNKEGGTRSAALNRVKFSCQSHCITLIRAYLPGVANLGADAHSRGQVSREWFLNPSVVEKIFKTLGRPQLDLFASRRSTHLPIYFSLERRSQQDSMPWIRIGILIHLN